MMELKDIFGKVIFAAAATSIAELVKLAVKSAVNLSGADLSGADLSGADLYGANLSRANLSRAGLYGANLSGANLSRANLSGANLSRANLSVADLSGAGLSRADLYGANLSGADLSGANLSGANLSGADLYGANLSRADLSDDQKHLIMQIVPETGSFCGWKKLKYGVIALVEIPAKAGRVSSTGRKCRAEYVRVSALFGLAPGGVGVSDHDGKTKYELGAIVRPDKWDNDPRVECTHGIHFFLTRREAEEY